MTTSIQYKLLLGSLLLLPGCGDPLSVGPADLEIVLAPHVGGEDLDEQIRKRQREVEEAVDPIPHLERLGQLFVTKARRSMDTGYYSLARSCAECIEGVVPGHSAALLLRGHVLHATHHFVEAEEVARRLVDQRGGFLDHGLLGDVLVDRGDLREALASYQVMLDLKPTLQSYVRAAHIRWLRGDLDGSRELLRLATGAGSPRAPEALCWAYSRLAEIELQAGDVDAAARGVSSALSLMPEYPSALETRARLEYMAGDLSSAIQTAARAVNADPLPRYQWFYADLLRASGDVGGAARVEQEIERTGPIEDPRTFAIYLATRGKDVKRARALVERELEQRSDVHTHDAMAWTSFRMGDLEAARTAMHEALAEGTRDARMFYHAGAIAAASGNVARAGEMFDRASIDQRMLLPVEADDLRRRMGDLRSASALTGERG